MDLIANGEFLNLCLEWGSSQKPKEQDIFLVKSQSSFKVLFSNYTNLSKKEKHMNHEPDISTQVVS